MTIQKPILQLGLLFVLFANTNKAQHSRQANFTENSKTDIYNNNCQECDSLGDQYLYTGDTSMAMHFYEKFIEKHPDDTRTVASLNKLRKLYRQRSQSFYLKEY